MAFLYGLPQQLMTGFRKTGRDQTEVIHNHKTAGDVIEYRSNGLRALRHLLFHLQEVMLQFLVQLANDLIRLGADEVNAITDGQRHQEAFDHHTKKVAVLDHMRQMIDTEEVQSQKY